MSRKGTPTSPLEEKRVAPRVDTRIPVTVIAGKRRIGFTVDELSVTGARLTGHLPLDVGQQIQIELRLDGMLPQELVAQVVRVHTADLVTDQIAVRFVDLPATVHAVIAAMSVASCTANDEDDERATSRLPKSLFETDLEASTIRVDKPKTRR